MLKNKKSGGGAGAAMGCGEPLAASPPTTKLTGRGNGGSPSCLLLSTRSLPSLFSTDTSMSPTSMTGSKNPPCSGARNGSSGHIGSPAAGLAAVLVAGEADREYSKNGRVLLGMRLRVQLPPPPLAGKGPGDLLGSPIEFGVKNRDAQLALLSPVQRSPLSSAARAVRRSEVEELTEDYTCVIARGPNPKMTHIFEDRVVESRAGGGGDGDVGDDPCYLLSSCCGCKNRPGQGKDPLLLQRGEKAFCRSQRHYQEALFGNRIRDSPHTSVELKP